MCGRMCCTLYPKYLLRYTNADKYDSEAVIEYKPKWNCTPKSKVMICYQAYEDEGSTSKITRVLTPAVWSIIPPFAKDAFASSGYSTFNARYERLKNNKLFGRLLDTKRCVILADGFFEWLRLKKEKTPFYFLVKSDAVKSADEAIPKAESPPPKDPKAHTKLPEKAWKEAETIQEVWEKSDVHERYREKPEQPQVKKVKTETSDNETSLTCTAAPVLFAALYDIWHYNDERVVSTTVITMNSKGTSMEKIHDRTPCCMSPDFAAKWLATEKYTFDDLAEELTQNCVKTMNERMYHYQIGPEVGNIKNDYREILHNVTLGVPANKQTKIGDFQVKQEEVADANVEEKKKGNTKKRAKSGD